MGGREDRITTMQTRSTRAGTMRSERTREMSQNKVAVRARGQEDSELTDAQEMLGTKQGHSVWRGPR